MAGVIIAAADFIASAIVAVGSATSTALTAIGLSGATYAVSAASVALAEGVADFGAALAFSSGLGAGLQAWAVTASIFDLALTKPKLGAQGSPQSFKADPNAPIPVAIGVTGVGGNIIYETTSGGSNKHGAAGNEYLTICTVLSGLGPINAIQQLKFNQTVVQWATTGRQGITSGYIPSLYLPNRNNPYTTPYAPSGTTLGGTNGTYNGNAWINTQLGARSGGSGFQPAPFDTNAPVSEWTSTKNLYGFAAAFTTFVYNTQAYSGGLPKPLWTVQGINVYDPRKDSTYPGGSGTQRWADPNTWAYSANPYIHALNFALGFYLPDPVNTGQTLLYAGIGAPMSMVDMAAFVAGANVADANGWTANGQWTTADDKYSVLTLLLQAGGGQPADIGGMISCIVQTPQTSLATFTVNDLGDGSVQVDTSATLRSRINRVFPKYREPNADYEFVQMKTPITVASYVTMDGRIRARELNYEFVTNVNQAAQLAAYDLVNTREGIVATIPAKLLWAQYKPGDCITLNLPDAGLNNVKVRIQKKTVDWRSMTVTLSVRSETDTKHTFALGSSGVAPTPAVITGSDQAIISAPLTGQWTASQATITDPVTHDQKNVIRVTGTTTDNLFASSVVVRYRITGSGSAYTTFVSPASSTTIDIPVAAGTYDVTVNYITLRGAEDPTQVLSVGPVTVSPSVPTSIYAQGPLATAALTPSQVTNTNITITGGTLNGIGTGAGTAVANSLITIGANGALAGAGGGAVTLPGLGAGTLATLNSVATTNVNANAISQIAAAYSAGPVGIGTPPTGSTIQTITFTCTGVAVDLSVAVSAQNAWTSVPPTMKLNRVQSGVTTTLLAVNPTDAVTTIAYLDTPAAGAVTYNLYCDSGDAAGGLAYRIYLRALELKR